jgi:outer membrane protein OmpA-like peptidoglycan-associated protein
MKHFARLCLLTAVLAPLAACSGLDRNHEEALDWAAGVEVKQASDDVAVELPETVLFDFGHTDLRSDAGMAINRAAVILARSDRPIVVEGHTDNAGTHEANMTVSIARAKVVAAALEHDGIAASRITIHGYAYDRPVASNDTEDGRAQNRRAEIRILGESVNHVLGQAKAVKESEAFRQPPAVQTETQSLQQQPATSSPVAAPAGTPARFVWPVQGQVSAPFVAGKTRGMLVTGAMGASVNAVADGRVVYAGNAVEAYGPLVIIQHRDAYVTAYAHNGRLLVKSNQTVTQGQAIAEMGDSGNGNGLLQFEIRRNGQQLDPLKFLPARND